MATTTKATHTPGPWKMVDRRDRRGNRCGFSVWRDLPQPYIGSPRGNQICATPDGTTPEAEANARLIAASPKLLDALEELLSYVGDGHDLMLPDPATHRNGSIDIDHSSANAEHNEQVARVIEAARHALAQATGND